MFTNSTPDPQQHQEYILQASRLLHQGVEQQQAGELSAAIKSLEQSLALFQIGGDCQKQAQVFVI